MIIAARYSFNGGAETVAEKYPHLLTEIEAAIASVNAEQHRSKQSKEKTRMGQMLYSPVSLNAAIKKELLPQAWTTKRVECFYSSEYYTEHYKNVMSVSAKWTLLKKNWA